MAIDWTQLIQTGAQLAGAAGAARAKGRADESQALNQRDATANSLYNTAQNAQMGAGQLDLQRQLAAQNMASQRAKSAVAGDLLSRMQDVSINVPGVKTASITGGLRPSAIGDVGRTSSALLAKQALMKQLEGDSFTGGNLLQPPTQSQLPQSNALDALLNYGGMAGSMAGAVMGSQQPSGEVWGGAPMDEAPVGENSSYVPKPTAPDMTEIWKYIQQLGGGAQTPPNGAY